MCLEPEKKIKFVWKILDFCLNSRYVQVSMPMYNLEQKYTNIKKHEASNIAVDNTATNN